MGFSNGFSQAMPLLRWSAKNENPQSWMAKHFASSILISSRLNRRHKIESSNRQIRIEDTIFLPLSKPILISLTIVLVHEVITCWTAQGVLAMIKTTEIAAADFDVASHIILFASIYKKIYFNFTKVIFKFCDLCLIRVQSVLAALILDFRSVKSSFSRIIYLEYYLGTLPTYKMLPYVCKCLMCLFLI